MSELEAQSGSQSPSRPGSFLRRLVDWADMPDPFAWLEGPGSTMRVEESTTEGEHVVRVEIPGIDPERDASVTVEGDVLRITATRQQRESSDKGGFHRSEFRYGSFSRTLPLPPGTDQDKVTATYKDGILEVRVPLPEDRPPTSGRIPITKA